MLTPDHPSVRSAPEAADLAGVTYRQLDYWTRKGWIVPADLNRVSPGRVVRRYGPAEIVQCALLAHLGGSGLDVTPFGPQVGELGELGPDDLVVVDQDGSLEVVAAGELRGRVAQRGRWVLFDPAPVLRRLARPHSAASVEASTRRTA
ncbi:MAG: MerR family transcriptional regulator [Acidimicrobiales bacterium]